MVGYYNYEIENQTDPNADSKAYDIHIEFNKKVNVIGIDGVSPSDPSASYEITGDCSVTIVIDEIEKKLVRK